MPKFRFRQSRSAAGHSPFVVLEGDQRPKEVDQSWANAGPMSESWAISVWNGRIRKEDIRSGSVPKGVLGCASCVHILEPMDLLKAGQDDNGRVLCPLCDESSVVLLPAEHGIDLNRHLAARWLRFLYQRFLIWGGYS